MKSTVWLIRPILIVIAAASLTACGASKINKDGSTDLSSRIPADEQDKEDKPIATCNIIDSPMLFANSMVYVDSYGNTRNEALRLKINRLHKDFESDPNFFIQFYRWKAQGDLSPSIDETPLEFAFELTSNRQKINGTTDILNMDILKEVATGINLQTHDLKTILSRLTIILNLKDPMADYHALKIVAYKYDPTNKVASVVSDLDTLIPAFYANPNDYALQRNGELRPMVLMQRHPFFDDLDKDLDEAYFKEAARNLCWSSIF